MLEIYLVSSLIYMIVLKVLLRITKSTAEMREIDFREYEDERIKGGKWIYLICLVPVLRVVLIGVGVFMAFGGKEELDKFMKGE